MGTADGPVAQRPGVAYHEAVEWGNGYDTGLARNDPGTSWDDGKRPPRCDVSLAPPYCFWRALTPRRECDALTTYYGPGGVWFKTRGACEEELPPNPPTPGTMPPTCYDETGQAIACDGVPGAGSGQSGQTADRYQQGFEEGRIVGFGQGFDAGFAEPRIRCSADGTTLAMAEVTATVAYRVGDSTQSASVVPEGCSGEAGLFSFFDPDRWEVLVRLIDGCALNGHWWLSVVAATDLPWEATVTRGDESRVVSEQTPLHVEAFACEAR